ncbi:hypothetical protein D3C75_706440 [compost metagenome]
MVDDIDQRVIALITKHSSYYPFRKQKRDTFTAESSIHFDVRLDQGEVEELIADFAREFTVDVSAFNVEAYYPEVKHSWNPFKKPDPVDVPDFTIDMFIKSAKAGKWLYD